MKILVRRPLFHLRISWSLEKNYLVVKIVTVSQKRGSKNRKSEFGGFKAISSVVNCYVCLHICRRKIHMTLPLELQKKLLFTEPAASMKPGPKNKEDGRTILMLLREKEKRRTYDFDLRCRRGQSYAKSDS